MNAEDQFLDATNLIIRRVVGDLGEPVSSALAPIARSGSRRRALLVFALADREVDRRSAAAGGAAIELIHLGTLIHDDVVDGSEMRRHHESLHQSAGLPAAIWAADALFTEAIQLAASISEAAGFFTCAALRRIAQSQIRESDAPSVDEYWDVVDGKTGALFELAFELADELSDGRLPGAVRDATGHFGRLFQYVDDLQDVMGDTATLGKPVGRDLANQLQTLPAIDLADSTATVESRVAKLQAVIRDEVASTRQAAFLEALSQQLVDAARSLLVRVP